MKNKKYGYTISFLGDGFNTGTIDLTEDEAKVVAYALNPVNWKHRNKTSRSPIVTFGIEHPTEIDEDFDNLEDIIIIKEFLEDYKNDIPEKSNKEIDSAWKEFSKKEYSIWLNPNDYWLDRFVEWLDTNKQN